MKRSVPAAAGKAKSLPQQNTDFTAEGSPPPGQVSGLAGIKAPGTRHAKSRTPDGIPGSRRRTPTGKKA
jgi:hypothetical protein